MSSLCTITVLTAIFSGVLFAGNSAGQSIREVQVSLEFKQASIQEVFSRIEEATEFVFQVSPTNIDKLPGQITLKVEKQSVAFVLQEIASQTGLTFKQLDATSIVVDTPKRESKLGEKKADHTLDRIIRGKVTDNEGAPLPGASILIKGTTVGAVTDRDGNYALSIPDNTTTLVISFIGYIQEEVEIAGRSIIDIVMLQDVTSLDEVVVSTGYWQVPEKYNTGNISQVTSKDIERQAISNPLQALQGTMAGVFVTQNTGVPGGGFNIQIRGQNSLRDDGNSPLYLVDGVPFPSNSLNEGIISSVKQRGNPLSAIHPDDIESIEILKDADATAIYGSRGANGVVLITTKKSEVGKPRLNVNISHGVGEVTNKVDLMNTNQVIEMVLEGLANDGREGLPANVLERIFPQAYVWDPNRETDWQEELLGGTAHQTNANITLAGGNNTTSFLIGGAFFRETTVYPGDNSFQRGSGRFSFSHNSLDGKLNVSASANYVSSQSTLPFQDLTRDALSLAPNAPQLYDEEGNLNWENGTWENPLAFLEREYNDQTDNLVTDARFSYELFDGLRVKSSFGFNSMWVNETRIEPLSALNPAELTPDVTGSGIFANARVDTWIAEPQLEYQKTISKGNLSVLVGTTFQQTSRDRETLRATGYSSDALILNPQAATDLAVFASEYTEYNYSAIFARAQYNWDGKYILNLTGRRDGSSRFGPGRQFGNFGALGTAWIFSEEDFVKSNLPVLSFGKLRLSYGTTGNDNIDDYGYLDSYSLTDHPYNGYSGLVVTRLDNQDFSWETVKKLEAGLEFGLWEDKIYTSVSWYRNRSTDQLVGRPLSLVTGDNSIQFNLPATVENRGWEFEITTMNIHRNNFQWTSSLNLTIPRNELVEFPNIEDYPIFDGRWQVGESIMSLSGKKYAFTGVNPETGLYDFVDYDGNGRISNADRQKYVEAGQEYFGGLNNTLRYKNFQLNFLFQFVKQTGQTFFSLFTQPSGRSNQPDVVVDRWQRPGDEAPFMQYSALGTITGFNLYGQFLGSDINIVDKSFVRLRNVSLSYDLPQTLLSRFKLQSLSLFVEAQNLLTITDFEGLDPEVIGTNLAPLRFVTGGIQLTL